MSSNYGSADFALFENLGGRQFATRRTFPVDGAAACITLHDRDNDGDLDMSGVDEVDDLIYLYDNTGAVAVAPAVPDARTSVRVAGANPVRDRAVVAVRLAVAGPARLSLVDVLGREVSVALDGALSAGEHTLPIAVAGLAPGVYAVRLVAGGEVRSARFTVAR